MRPTGLGVKAALFYLLLVAAFFAAPYANLFFLLLVFLTLLGVADAPGARANVAGAHGRVDDVMPMPAGAGGAITAFVCAGRRPWALGVELDLERAGTLRAAVGEVAGETRIVVLVPPLARGVYPPARRAAQLTVPG